MCFYFGLACAGTCETFPMAPHPKARLPPCLRSGISLPVFAGRFFVLLLVYSCLYGYMRDLPDVSESEFAIPSSACLRVYRFLCFAGRIFCSAVSLFLLARVHIKPSRWFLIGNHASPHACVRVYRFLLFAGELFCSVCILFLPVRVHVRPSRWLLI